jgi:exonuclease SbcD
MYTFAHFSDVHIGAFRHPILQNLVLQAFKQAIDICIKRAVDFVIFSGDLFDSNLPDMGIANEAVKKLRGARDSGIDIYLVYGSHDFSPTQTSIVDILESAGLFKKVTKGKVVERKLRLDFNINKKTGAKIVGIHGRKSGIEREYFDILDKECLEKESGFKIFVFHGAVTEFKPAILAAAESIPVSNLPREFEYYAAGHIHEKTDGKLPGYEHILYSGILFAADYRDLEQNALGMERGFFIVSFDDKVRDIEFVKVPVCEYAFIQYDATDKNASKVQGDLFEAAKKLDTEGKLVLLKVKGEMSGGKTSDIDFAAIRRLIEDKGALHVTVNHFGLTSKEYADIKVAGQDIHEVEARLFEENIGTVKVSQPKLKGKSGVQLSLELLKVLRQEQKVNELKKDYESRVVRSGLESLELKEAIE